MFAGLLIIIYALCAEQLPALLCSCCASPANQYVQYLTQPHPPHKEMQNDKDRDLRLASCTRLNPLQWPGSCCNRHLMEMGCPGLDTCTTPCGYASSCFGVHCSHSLQHAAQHGNPSANYTTDSSQHC